MNVLHLHGNHNLDTTAYVFDTGKCVIEALRTDGLQTEFSINKTRSCGIS